MSSLGSLPPVALVDDDAKCIFVMREMLALAKLQNPVLSFADGLEARDYLAESLAAPSETLAPCLVLLDIKMPLLSGFDFLTWIRAQPALKQLKVVVLSSSDDFADLHQAKERGADGYFVKFPPLPTLAAVLAGCRGVRLAARQPAVS